MSDQAAPEPEAPPRWPASRVALMLVGMTAAIAVLVVVTDRFAPRDRSTVPPSPPTPETTSQPSPPPEGSATQAR